MDSPKHGSDLYGLSDLRGTILHHNPRRAKAGSVVRIEVRECLFPPNFFYEEQTLVWTMDGGRWTLDRGLDQATLALFQLLCAE
jgi:hypothetical protein